MSAVPGRPSQGPPYAYACVDRSPLVQPFCRYVVRWFVAWMPLGVPANLLTLGSSACVWAMLCAATMGPPAGAIVCLVLMSAYVIYDHADGMHARRTGASGPLGEFLDHYLDAFHGPIAMTVIFQVAGQEHMRILPVAVWAVALAGAATMVEQRERRVLYFGVIGPLEGMLVTIAILGSWCVPGPRAFWLAPHALGLTPFAVVATLCCVACLATVAGCVARIGRLPRALAAYLASSGLLLWASAGTGRPWWAAPLLLALHGADFSGRTILGHLRDSARAVPDLAAPCIVAAAAWLGRGDTWAIILAACYLAIRNALDAASALRAYRRMWRWWNPRGGAFTSG